jgi:acyl-CoA synthetase (NDP forming)
VSNPVDAARFVSFAQALPALQAILASGEVDCLCLTGMFFDADAAAEHELAAVDTLVSMARTSGTWLAVTTMVPGSAGARRFASRGVPVFDFPDEMLRALSLVRWGRRRRSIVALDETADVAAGVAHWDYMSARAELARYGLTFNQCEAADTWDAVRGASRRIGFPLALKALASSHKSDTGGVALNIADETTLRLHFERMVASIGWARFSVERMVDGAGAIEILIGAVRDPTFGPIVAVGIGGTLAELHRDTVFALAPVERDFAFEMMDRLSGARLLKPYRGRKAIDRERVADAVVALSRFMLDHPHVVEAEINPLIAGATGAIAVDARVRARSSEASRHD